MYTYDLSCCRFHTPLSVYAVTILSLVDYPSHPHQCFAPAFSPSCSALRMKSLHAKISVTAFNQALHPAERLVWSSAYCMNFSSSWSFALVGGPFWPSAFLPPIDAQAPRPVTARVAIDSYKTSKVSLDLRTLSALSEASKTRGHSSVPLKG